MINPPMEPVLTMALVPKNDRDYTPVAIDIRALQQLAAHDLAEFFYSDFKIYCDVFRWFQYFRTFSDKWYTPIFQSSEDEFYLLVCNTFHNHHRRYKVGLGRFEKVG
jgi:hypothetical protein